MTVLLFQSHAIKKEQYIIFFKTLRRFIAAGGYNTEHMHWGSRLILIKECELLKTIKAINLTILSTGKFTYSPSDP